MRDKCSSCQIAKRIRYEKIKRGQNPSFKVSFCDIRAVIQEEEERFDNTITFNCGYPEPFDFKDWLGRQWMNLSFFLWGWFKGNSS